MYKNIDFFDKKLQNSSNFSVKPMINGIFHRSITRNFQIKKIQEIIATDTLVLFLNMPIAIRLVRFKNISLPKYTYLFQVHDYIYNYIEAPGRIDRVKVSDSLLHVVNDIPFYYVVDD